MKRLWFAICFGLVLLVAGCTGKPGPGESDVMGSGTSSGAGGEGAGPTGTSGDAPAEVAPGN